ncbi:MAG: isoprenylcysteine carboxylmethyltransferase family protein [Pseudomonadota bacterium]
MSHASPPRTPLAAWRPLAAELGGLLVMGALLFAAAGRLDWAQGWAFLALWGIAMALPDIALARENPGLLLRRAVHREPPRRYERVLWACYLLLILALPVVAGLDVQRFHWSRLPAFSVHIGIPLILVGSVVSAWVRIENPHYESTMRIQRDMGHKVIYNGPYRIVRHPGYLATAVQIAGAPLVLCSAWAAIPAGGLVLVMALRAFFEDRALMAGLKGYAAYARQVPAMLVPGLW